MQQDPILTPIFASALAGVGLPVTIGGINIASVLTTATLLGTAVGLNYLLAPSAPKPEQGKNPLKQTVQPRFAGFGEVRMAGAYALYESAAGQSHDIFALAQGPAGGFKRFLLSDTAITVNSSGVVQEAAEGAYGEGLVTMAVRRGEKLETAFNIPQLASIWTSNHRGDRIVQLLLQCRSVKLERFQKRYPNGLPKPSAVLFLPCWDFRDPTQDPDDPDTWIDYPVYDAETAYVPGDRVLHGGLNLPGISAPGGMLWLCLEETVGVEPGTDATTWVAVWKNPVLQIVTYLISQDIGMGLPRGRLITPALASLAVQANRCDEPVAKVGGFEPRYSSCPWWRLDTNPEEVLGQMLAACYGWVGLGESGRLALSVGVYSEPKVSLDEDVILDVDVAYSSEDENKVDELTLTVVSPDHDYTSQPIESWRNEEAILTRGKVRSQAFGPLSVQSFSQLRRLAKKMMLRANALHGVVTTNLGGMVAAGHRWVTLNYPHIPELDGAVIEIIRRQTSWADRKMTFEFVVVDPDKIDAWDPAVEEGDPPANPEKIAKQGLAEPQNVGGQAIGTPPFRLVLSWDDPGRQDLTWRVRYRLADAGGGIPGEWSAILDFPDPTNLGSRLQVTVYPTSEDLYEVEIAAVAHNTLGPWSDPVLVSLELPRLDYALPANSQYLTLLIP